MNSLGKEINTATLFERLGATEGVRQLVDGVIDAHMLNPEIKARFLPYQDDADHLAGIKKHVCDFFVLGAGGPDRYEGRSMPEAHRGMNINAAEFLAATDDILDTMEQHGHDAATRNEVLAIVYSLKDEIIRV
ncbi:hemoglobin [Roseovarius halotolerans]|uniref:Group 1 truncated hemoglobin GlbN n=1 Tax=Roseovarius halotolerans TaxID=505353 RepID=A0A1X6ZV55_9RHOB|nr:group 1 truncated hemoglobin [Roseovarius halotolerans]RKT27844.1 hemoglobin [Roseovarius halotolerans]SLN60704.1 Group 1 truncated hemoglobin GlbN [Roseovarius halotolerans]